MLCILIVYETILVVTYIVAANDPKQLNRKLNKVCLSRYHTVYWHFLYRHFLPGIVSELLFYQWQMCFLKNLCLNVTQDLCIKAKWESFLADSQKRGLGKGLCQ